MNELLANDAARIAILLLLFVAVVAVAYGVTVALEERRRLRERLVGGQSSQPVDEEGAPIPALRAHDARGAWVAMVTAIEKAVEGKA